MKNACFAFALVFCGGTLLAASFPIAEISNGQVDVKFFLPDAEKGYYRATRFDWSGIIHSLTYAGHEYFGLRSGDDEPAGSRKAMGLSEEFRRESSEVGYDEADVGGGFIRVGIGVLEKPEEKGFRWSHNYRILDPGARTVKQGKDWIEFTHELRSRSGYGYLYTKRISLAAGRPVLVISHTLRNTGSKTIDTRQYNHNFFMIDHQPPGPQLMLKLPFDPKTATDLKGLMKIEGRDVGYLRKLEQGESLFVNLTGYEQSVEHFRFAIENRDAGAGVRMEGDSPLEWLGFWTDHNCMSPEPFVKIHIEPGREQSWTLTYEFYTIP